VRQQRLLHPIFALDEPMHSPSPRSPKLQDSKADSPRAESPRQSISGPFPHSLAPKRPLARGPGEGEVWVDPEQSRFARPMIRMPVKAVIEHSRSTAVGAPKPTLRRLPASVGGDVARRFLSRFRTSPADRSPVMVRVSAVSGAGGGTYPPKSPRGASGFFHRAWPALRTRTQALGGMRWSMVSLSCPVPECRLGLC
jgi:hypothetical protein